MPIQAHVWWTDDTGKAIDGSVSIAGREGSCEVIEFDHELRMPIDSDDGTITGTRKHEPMTITMKRDKAITYLYKAVANGQTLKKVDVVWYEIDDTGAEVEYYRHTLEDVKITSIKPKMFNCKDLDKERYPHLEVVSLKYGAIAWKTADGNLSYRDTWNER